MRRMRQLFDNFEAGSGNIFPFRRFSEFPAATRKSKRRKRVSLGINKLKGGKGWKKIARK